MNKKHFQNLTDGAESRREYKSRRRAGRTPEGAIMESLDCFEKLQFRNRNGEISPEMQDWFLAEIAAIKTLLPIAKF